MHQTKKKYVNEKVASASVDIATVTLTGIPLLDKFLKFGKRIRGQAQINLSQECAAQLQEQGYRISAKQILQAFKDAEQHEQALDRAQDSVDYIDAASGSFLPTGFTDFVKIPVGLKEFRDTVPIEFNTFETESGERQEFVSIDHHPPKHL